MNQRRRARDYPICHVLEIGLHRIINKDRMHEIIYPCIEIEPGNDV